MSYQQNHPLATSPTDIGQESLRSRPELELMWQRMTIIGESTRKLREVLSATGEMPLPYSTIADRAEHNMPTSETLPAKPDNLDSGNAEAAPMVEQSFVPQGDRRSDMLDVDLVQGAGGQMAREDSAAPGDQLAEARLRVARASAIDDSPELRLAA